MCVGRVRTAWWKDACADYEKRLARLRRLEVVEVKDAESAPDAARRVAVEGARLLEALDPRDTTVVLDERGRDLTSVQLAAALDGWDARGQGRVAFVVGGPFGLSDEVRGRAALLLRLSAMTLPHELARVVLLEQLYRAETLRARIPYHH